MLRSLQCFKKALPVVSTFGGCKARPFPAQAIINTVSRRHVYTGIPDSTVYSLGIPNCIKNVHHLDYSKLGSIEFSKMMDVTDANWSGNVHGGTILSALGVAGMITSTRFMNENSEGKQYCTRIARLGHMDFLAPVHVGDVCKIHCKIIFASSHSILVLGQVFTESVCSENATGETKLSNQAFMWFVSSELKTVNTTESALTIDQQKERDVSLDAATRLSTVPKVTAKTDFEKELFAYGEASYKQLKKIKRHETVDILSFGEDMEDMYMEKETTEYSLPCSLPPNSWHHVPIFDSMSTLVHCVLPSDCLAGNIANGGVVMKLMDTVAGITAWRHCRTTIVTASLDALDFLKPIMNGDVLRLNSRCTFASSKVLEIEVIVERDDIMKGVREITNRGRFLFVSLGDDGRTQKIPGLVLTTKDAVQRFQQGKLRHVVRKDRRRQEKLTSTK